MNRADATTMSPDPHRPIYHFLPTANWLNDPNGLIWWRGWHHLFYQYNPHGAFHGTIHWGHARSRDLVHWEHLPVALTPLPNSPDQDGCYSGCAVDDNGTPTFVYTGVRQGAQTPCLAVAQDDDLIAWRPDPANPVIAAPPPDFNPVGFRDHTVWREADGWHMLIGAGIQDVGGLAPHFRSPDLRRWEYLGPLLSGDVNVTEPYWTGEMWECPDFFPVGDQHVLVISVWHRGRLNPYDGKRTYYPAAYVGRYRDGAFQPDHLTRLDAGMSFYAPQSYRDGAGRRVMFGWLKEQRTPEAQLAAGWSGAMALPRIITVGADGRLRYTPEPALETLRRDHRRETITLDGAGARVATSLRGAALEVIARFEPGRRGVVGLAVRHTPDGAETTRILVDRSAGRLIIDTANASLDATTRREVDPLPFPLDPDQPLALRVFIDHSAIEVFGLADGDAGPASICAATRVYPTRPDAVEVAVVADEPVRATLDGWTMASIWADQ